MKQMFLILAAVSTLSLVGCGDPATQSNGSSMNQSVNQSQGNTSTGSICVWGMGIFTSLDEFKSYIQNKINTGQLDHCVALDGKILTFTSPNGLFGPCLGAISQAEASYSQWASCSSSIQ